MPVDNKKWKARELRSFVSRRTDGYYRVSKKPFEPHRKYVGNSNIPILCTESDLPEGSRVDFSFDYDGDIKKRGLLQCLDHVIRVHGPDTVVWEEKEDGSGGGSSSDSSSSASSNGKTDSSNQQEGAFIIVDLKGSSSGGTSAGSGTEAKLFGAKTCAAGASAKLDQLRQCQDQYQQSSSIMDVPPVQDGSGSVSEKSEHASAYGDPNKGTDPLDRFWGKVTDGKGDQKTDGSSQLSDTPNCDGSDTDGESLTSNGSTGLNDHSGARRDVPEAKKQSGGYYTRKERVEEERRKIEAKARKEIYRALYKLLRAVDIGGLDCSPRLEGARLVREIIYKRYSLARTKRDELEKSIAFIAVDNSGSCSVCCDEMLATALEVHRENPDKIHIVLHSNGWVSDKYGNQTGEKLDQAVIRLAKGKKVAAVVAFGDWDAGNQYKRIAESGVPLIWLDHEHNNKPCPIYEGMRAVGWKINPMFHWDGIYDPKTTAIAFREMAKQIRRGK